MYTAHATSMRLVRINLIIFERVVLIGNRDVVVTAAAVAMAAAFLAVVFCSSKNRNLRMVDDVKCMELNTMGG